MSGYQKQDRFFKKAKQDRFVARSVYKLDELDRRYRLFKKDPVVIDLGCAPGSWLQYLSERVGRKGLAIGYDRVVVEAALGPRVRAYVADVASLDPERIRRDIACLSEELGGANAPKVDAVISDMAPKLTGIRDADQAKSVEIVGQAFRLARGLLNPEQGVFVAKLFQGRDTDGLVSEVKGAFREVKLLKPEATRDGSREVFVLGRLLRPEGRLSEDSDSDPVRGS